MIETGTEKLSGKKIIFITGTSTGIGKTVVTASLVRALGLRGIDAVAAKPFASGCTTDSDWRDDDAQLLMAAAQTREPLDVISPHRFTHPLAPVSAAELENRTISLTATIAAMHDLAARHQVLLVEGVGGAAVPLQGEYLVSDFARDLGAPVVVVASSALGTVNHTLLTVAHLRARGADPCRAVFVRPQAGPLTLAEETGVPLACKLARITSVGVVPFIPEFDTAASLPLALEALPTLCDPIQQLANEITGVFV